MLTKCTHICCKTKKFLCKNVLGKIYFRSKNWKMLGLQEEQGTHTVLWRSMWDLLQLIVLLCVVGPAICYWEIAKFLIISFLKNTSRRLLLCGPYFKEIFLCWRFVSRQLQVLKTQGLQRSKDNKGRIKKKKDSKGKMNEDLLRLANIWNITKSLQGAEAATQRCSKKSKLCKSHSEIYLPESLF